MSPAYLSSGFGAGAGSLGAAGIAGWTGAAGGSGASGKIAGAGGGGCMVALAPDAVVAERVLTALRALGAESFVAEVGP